MRNYGCQSVARILIRAAVYQWYLIRN